MKKRIILSLLILTLLITLALPASSSPAKTFPISVKEIKEKKGRDEKAVVAQVEHARTAEESIWGLMGRNRLPEDAGMLFHFHSPKELIFWCFNCQIDLTLALIDEEHIIREMHDLDSHFEMMDPARPVENISDISKYSNDDPIIQFFKKAEIHSKQPLMYCLEMNKGWFAKNDIQIGDRVDWDEREDKKEVFIYRTKEIDSLNLHKAPFILYLTSDKSSFWAPQLNSYLEVHSLDESQKIIATQIIKTPKQNKPSKRPVILPAKNSKSLILAPLGWKKRFQLADKIRLKLLESA